MQYYFRVCKCTCWLYLNYFNSFVSWVSYDYINQLSGCRFFELRLITIIENYDKYFFSADDSGESQKWQQHLSLLRTQYVNLYTANTELQQKYAIATASKEVSGFIERLLATVASLYGQQRYRYVLMHQPR